MSQLAHQDGDGGRQKEEMAEKEGSDGSKSLPVKHHMKGAITRP